MRQRPAVVRARAEGGGRRRPDPRRRRRAELAGDLAGRRPRHYAVWVRPRRRASTSTAKRVGSWHELRLRLDRDRLGLRRQRVGAAAGREGLPRRGARVRARASTTRTSPTRPGRRGATTGCRSIGHEGHPPDDAVQGHLHRLAAAASAAAASATPTRCTAPRPDFYRRPAVVASWPTGSASSRRTTTRPSACSASSTTTRTRRPTCCSRSSRDEPRRRRQLPQDARRRVPRRAGQDRARPVLRRRGPRAHGLHRAAGECMVGCRHGAKNTLRKNYLWFAERSASKILAERTVTDIEPIGARDGADGYEVTSRASGAWVRRDRETLTARGVVVRRRRARHQPAAASAASSPGRCRSSPSGSASSCAPTASRSWP